MLSIYFYFYFLWFVAFYWIILTKIFDPVQFNEKLYFYNKKLILILLILIIILFLSLKIKYFKYFSLIFLFIYIFGSDVYIISFVFYFFVVNYLEMYELAVGLGQGSKLHLFWGTD